MNYPATFPSGSSGGAACVKFGAALVGSMSIPFVPRNVTTLFVVHRSLASPVHDAGVACRRNTCRLPLNGQDFQPTELVLFDLTEDLRRYTPTWSRMSLAYTSSPSLVLVYLQYSMSRGQDLGIAVYIPVYQKVYKDEFGACRRSDARYTCAHGCGFLPPTVVI